MNTNTKLTKSFVDSVHEAGFYWDRDIKGFGLRISGNTKSYIVQRRINGKDKRRLIGRHGIFTPETARKRALEFLVLMQTGTDPKEESRARREEGLTLQELLNEYLLRKSLAPRTRSDYKGYLKSYFPDWVKKAITDIKPDMVEQRHRELGQAHGEAQADVAFRALRALFNYAEGVYTRKNGDQLITSNPCKRLSAKKLWFKPRCKETYIPEEKFHLWFTAVNQLKNELPDSNTETVCDYLLFLAFTGLRRTEASLIRWEHVDFDGRRFMLPRENVKNDMNFSLPMTTFTHQLLKRRFDAKQSDYVFPGKGKSGHIVEPKYVIEKIIAVSGVTFTPHDLRRTYASYAAAVVEDLFTIKRLMNHLSGGDVTLGYIQGVERLRKPAQRVTNYMLKKSEPVSKDAK